MQAVVLVHPGILVIEHEGHAVHAFPERAETEGAKGCGGEVNSIKMAAAHKVTAGDGQSAVAAGFDAAKARQACPEAREALDTMNGQIGGQMLHLPDILAIAAAPRVDS